MTKLTQEEFLKLIEDVLKEQESFSSDPEPEWKCIDSPTHNCIDLTDTKIDKIKENICNFSDIRIGKFLFKIINYANNKSELNAVIYENGPKILISKIDVLNDVRFGGNIWQKSFNTFKTGMYINIDDAIKIIRWLQALHKIGCFV